MPESRQVDRAFDELFAQLRDLLSSRRRELNCVRDEPGNLYIETRFIMGNGKPLFFAAVQTRKRYVSYHLMPVYVQPDLLDSLSPELRARMHGKSCFNFRAITPELLDELGKLTESGYASYRGAGYV